MKSQLHILKIFCYNIHDLTILVSGSGQMEQIANQVVVLGMFMRKYIQTEFLPP